MSWIFEIFGFNDLKTNLRKSKCLKQFSKRSSIFDSLLEKRDGCFELFEFVSGKGIPFCSKWPKPQFPCHLAIPNETPRISIVEEITLETLDPCVWRYVLNQDDLANFRLKVRSDVIGTWEMVSTAYNRFYCQVKIVVSGCGFKSAISKSKKTHLGLKVDEDSVAIAHTRVLLLPPCLSKLTKETFYWLKRDSTPATGSKSLPRVTISNLQDGSTTICGRRRRHR